MNSTQPTVRVTASLDDPFYYLANFRFVLGWVAERHADLLGMSFLNRFVIEIRGDEMVLRTPQWKSNAK